jgi:hypothetical protein
MDLKSKNCEYIVLSNQYNKAHDHSSKGEAEQQTDLLYVPLPYIPPSAVKNAVP